jgi:outer membrane protein
MKACFNRFLPTLGLGVMLASFSLSELAKAEDLQQIYQLAAQKDPEIRGARAHYNSTHTLIDQGRSLLLPTIGATAATSRDTSGVANALPPSLDPTGRYKEHSFDNGFNSHSWGLNLTQALVNFKAWYAYQSARIGDESAALILQQAEQQLILKVAKAYFDVLRSQAFLASYNAEEKAAMQQLEQTKQRFDVGLVAITDVYDSQANADLASVNRLTEENNLQQKLEALSAITGQTYTAIAELAKDFPIESLAPANMNEWVKMAQDNNLAIKIAQLDLDSKVQDAKSARADYYPTVNLVATFNWSQSGNPASFFPGLASEASSLRLNFTIPIFTGGLTSSRSHQAYYNRDASQEALLKSERDNIQLTRNAYRSVETDVKSVAARAKAVVSAQSAMDATRVGAEVGTRNVVDVVLSQRLLFQAQRDHAGARFNFVLDSLTLKQAAGVLSPQDVADLNQWLKP